MINTHGLKIKGLKKIAGACNQLPAPGCYSLNGSYSVYVRYNRTTGEAWYSEDTQNLRRIGYDDNIIFFEVRHPMTMQELADFINFEIDNRNHNKIL